MATITNLVTNPSFETNTTGWDATSVGLTISQDSTEYIFGSYSLKLVNNTQSTTGYIYATTPIGTSGIPISPSTLYTFSAYCKHSVTDSINGTDIRIQWYDSSGTYISRAASSDIFFNTTWTRNFVQTVSPSNAAYAALQLSRNDNGNNIYKDVVTWYDGIMLNTGGAVDYFDGSTTDTATKDYSWTGTAHNSTSTSTSYGGILKTGVYTVKIVTTTEKSSQYTINDTINKQLSMNYAIQQIMNITKSADYMAIYFPTINKTAAYTVMVDGDNIEKPSSYELIFDKDIYIVSGYEVRASNIQKTYMYKVYNSDTTVFYGTWTNEVISDFELWAEINTAGSAVQVRLARPADDYGEGFDVNYRNRVDVYVIDKEQPNGKIVFTGYISSYEPDYQGDTINVTLMSYGADLNKQILEDLSGNTTLSFMSEDPSNILLNIMTYYGIQGGLVLADNYTVDATGTTVSYTFNTVTVKEAIDKVLELSPADWYYYIDPATNKLHFHQKSDTPNYMFAIGRDISDLKIKKDMEKVVNTVYFSGGGSPALYKKYINQTSIDKYGVRGVRYKDGRVTLTSTADIIKNRLLRGDPEILVNLTVLDSNMNDYGYDLETIELGKIVKIGSSGNGPKSQYDAEVYDTGVFDYDLTNLSSIVFQITGYVYRGDTMEFSLSTTPPDITKRIQDITRNLVDIQNSDNPSAPS